MNAPFYDITKSYEQNWKSGPPLLHQNIKPKQRTITKIYKFLGFDINMPFGIPAGPLLNSKYIKAAFEFGFDVCCYKTQRSQVFPSNPFPNILYVDIDGDLSIEKAEKLLVGSFETGKKRAEINITNSFGNPSYGPLVWQEDMRKALSYAQDGQLLIASVVGTIPPDKSEDAYFDDFAKTALLAKEAGVKVVELNLGCPNVATEGVICYTHHAVVEVCKRSKKAVNDTPLIIKLAYYTKGQQALLERIITDCIQYINGVCAVNTIAAKIVDKNGNQALPGPGRLISGVCGASIKWAGVDMVQRLSNLRSKLRKDFAIIGVGGVMTPEDYQDYRNAGADLVQSATGAMWNPNLAYEVWEKESIKKR